MSVYAWGVPQWFLIVYFILFTFFPLVVRAIMMAAGVKGFGPWGEYLRVWAARLVHPVVICIVLFFGGYWN